MADAKNWWAPIWRGLVSDRNATHYQKMRSALWLYVFLLLHADRQTGLLVRKIRTICSETGIKRRTVLRWLRRLRAGGYITTRVTGRCLEIQVTKWKRLAGVTQVAHQRRREWHRRGDTNGTAGAGMKRLDTLIRGHQLPGGTTPNES